MPFSQQVYVLSRPSSDPIDRSAQSSFQWADFKDSLLGQVVGAFDPHAFCFEKIGAVHIGSLRDSQKTREVDFEDEPVNDSMSYCVTPIRQSCMSTSVRSVESSKQAGEAIQNVPKRLEREAKIQYRSQGPKRRSNLVHLTSSSSTRACT